MGKKGKGNRGGDAETKPLLDETVLDFRYGGVSDKTVAKNQRSALLKGVKLGDENSERLDASIAMASSTDEVGYAILQNLQEQREKILCARVSTETMEEDMNISKRKMTRMACEKCIQKWVLWVIVGCVLAGVIFYAYCKLKIEPDKQSGVGTEATAEAALGRTGARRLLGL